MQTRKLEVQDQIPAEVCEVLGILAKNKFSAHLVGGCVRDFLLNRTPSDFDVVTNATPKEIQKIFPRTVAVGAHFGVVIVLVNDIQIEVATFRADGKYIDGRHPTKVIFSDAKTDAKRRDFTINGLFWDYQTCQVIDYVGGITDIENKSIRAIGNPEKRFNEDGLRLLRAVRFYSQLYDYGFAIEPRTLEAISTCIKNLQKVSKERITEEFKKISTSVCPGKGLKKLIETKVAAVCCQPLEDLSNDSLIRLIAETNNWIKIWSELSANEPNTTVFWALIQKAIGHNSLNEFFVLPKKTLDTVKKILAETFVLDVQGPPHTFLHFFASEHFQEYLTYRCCIDKDIEASCDQAKEIIRQKKDLLKKGPLLPKPLISGADLKRLGIPPGPNFKPILSTIYNLQLDELIKSKADALKHIKKHYF